MYLSTEITLVKKTLYGLIVLTATYNVPLQSADINSDETLEILENLFKKNRFFQSEIKDLYYDDDVRNLLNNSKATDIQEKFYKKTLSHYCQNFDNRNLYKSQNLDLLFDILPPYKKESFCLNVLEYYSNNKKLHVIQEDILGLVRPIRMPETKFFLKQFLHHHLKTEKLHEIQEQFEFMVNHLDEDAKSSFCLDALDYYLDNEKLHQIQDILNPLINNLKNNQKLPISLRILNYFLKKHNLYEIKNFWLTDILTKNTTQFLYTETLYYLINNEKLCDNKEILNSLINQLSPENRPTFCLKALNHYEPI